MTPGLINSGSDQPNVANAVATDSAVPDPSAPEKAVVAPVGGAPQDPILRRAEMKIESQLTKKVRMDYTRIVISGMQLAMDGGQQSIIYKLKDSKDPVKDAAIGAVNMVFLMRKQSHGTMPPKAMVPAAMTLMLKALDFADKSGLVQMDTEKLVRATHIFSDHMFQVMGLSKQMLQTAAVRTHGMMNNPVDRAAIEKAAGMRKAY